MGVISTQQVAPPFTLPGAQGGEVTPAAPAGGLGFFYFYRISSPACYFQVGLVERLHRAYGQAGLTVWGISQDEALDTLGYAASRGATFPMFLDQDWRVSAAYGLERVPAFVLIDGERHILASAENLSKAELEAVSRLIAARLGVTPVSMREGTEDIPEAKAG